MVSILADKIWTKQKEQRILAKVGKPKKIIYVAGAYRAKTEWDLVNNIRHAEEASLRLWRQGWVVITPHKNTMNFQGALPDEVWLTGCLTILRRCDSIYMLSNWMSSEGARAELELAERLGLEIYYESN